MFLVRLQGISLATPKSDDIQSYTHNISTVGSKKGRINMIDYLKKFERIVTGVLIVMLAIVVVLALIELGWILIQDILKPPLFILEINDLLEIFGLFLLVLIGIELLDTIKCYYVEGRIDLKVIFTVALIAIGRKIIILEPEKYDGLTLIGIGVIIFALVTGYFIVSTKGINFQRSRTKPRPPEV
jgi:uncharacterized membrane protein (DUF373 family)